MYTYKRRNEDAQNGDIVVEASESPHISWNEWK